MLLTADTGNATQEKTRQVIVSPAAALPVSQTGVESVKCGL